MVTGMKNFQISAQGVFQSQNAILGFLGGVLAPSVQLIRHNFGWPETFQGIAKITRMCLLYVSFDGALRFGRYDPENSGFFYDGWRPRWWYLTSLARGQHPQHTLYNFRVVTFTKVANSWIYLQGTAWNRSINRVNRANVKSSQRIADV